MKKTDQLKEFNKMIVSADVFKKSDGYSTVYEFPFDVLDKTPGGSNLGRIEWHMEFIPGKKQTRKYMHGRRYYEKIYVWATQTRDKRYQKKVFEIPCFVECITGDSLRARSSFMHHVWRVMPCELHDIPTFSAYPANHHRALRIPIDSTISIEPEFV